ncbi:hypothetical protein N0B44_15030 [Roseibacterium beibuensis]|uniref:hypothetical protein n=1 Tax=[Roseibacterium] beibuensis TaxID=1193142 RepID=UPI00217EEB05|nr:hypothetical protein [Roseibacterium beibuensis]MCS6624230.1 hypothetical protein [Roseibacterium beibuensis]
MENHVAAATVGFVAFVFLALLLLATEATAKTRDESSLLQWRQEFADRMGWGSWERFQQNPIMLCLQVWMMRAVTFTAFCFTCWHAANAVFE